MEEADIKLCSHNIRALLVMDRSGERILSKRFATEFDEQDDGELEQNEEFEQKVFNGLQVHLKEKNRVDNDIFPLSTDSRSQSPLLCAFRTHGDLLFTVLAQKASIDAEEQQQLHQKSFLRALLDHVVRSSTQALATAPQLGLSLLSSIRDQEQQKKQRTKKRPATDEMERRASKGRRIRYVEIQRLVNFFPAMPERTAWTYERRSELFKSLFT